MTLAVLPRMLERGTGTIVNVSSVGGRLGIFHECAYSASKFALCGWSEAMAVDLHGTGVSVKLIEPGPVDTEIWDQPDNEAPVYRVRSSLRRKLRTVSSPRWAPRDSSIMCPT